MSELTGILILKASGGWLVRAHKDISCPKLSLKDIILSGKKVCITLEGKKKIIKMYLEDHPELILIGPNALTEIPKPLLEKLAQGKPSASEHKPEPKLEMEHTSNIPKQNRSRAPYNFVPLNTKVVPGQLDAPGRPCDFDRYYPEKP